MIKKCTSLLKPIYFHRLIQLFMHFTPYVILFHDYRYGFSEIFFNKIKVYLLFQMILILNISFRDRKRFSKSIQLRMNQAKHQFKVQLGNHKILPLICGPRNFKESLLHSLYKFLEWVLYI